MKVRGTTTYARQFLSLVVMALLLWISGCADSGGHQARLRWEDTPVMHHATPARNGDAAPDFAEQANLQELIALVESNNPGLRAAFERWTAAVQQISRATALPDPKLSYTNYLRPVETRVGPQRHKLGLSQTIPLFGKLGLRGRAAAEAANAAGARFESARLELRYRVARLWYDYYYLGRALTITDENMSLLTKLESVALAQYIAGRAPHSAVIRAQVELGRLEDRLRTLRDRRAPLLARLNAELNRPQSAPIAWPISIEFSPLPLALDELRSTLLNDSPLLSVLSSVAKSEGANAGLAGKRPVPDLTLGVQYIITDDARAAGTPGSGDDAAMVSAAINLPLWFGGNRAEREQAKARHSAVKHDHEQLRNQLLAELEQVHFELRDAERRVELYAHTLLPKAHQALEVTENAFTTGGADFLDLMDSQRTLLEFALAHERALADRATRRAQLEQLVGLELTAD